MLAIMQPGAGRNVLTASGAGTVLRKASFSAGDCVLGADDKAFVDAQGRGRDAGKLASASKRADRRAAVSAILSGCGGVYAIRGGAVAKTRNADM
jgi:hypothetical protein